MRRVDVIVCRVWLSGVEQVISQAYCYDIGYVTVNYLIKKDFYILLFYD